MDTGKNLRYMRQCAGMTQKELAEKAIINIRTLQNYEQGQNDISKASINKLVKLALALDCNIDDLLPPRPIFEKYFSQALDKRPGM